MKVRILKEFLKNLPDDLEVYMLEGPSFAPTARYGLGWASLVTSREDGSQRVELEADPDLPAPPVRPLHK